MPRVTPSQPQHCPTLDPKVPLLEDSALFPTPSNSRLSLYVLPQYLAYFNAGGDPHRLPPSLRPERELDLTGDGVPELLLHGAGLFILGCMDGEYVALLDWADPDQFVLPEFGPITDANQNGLPEIVTMNFGITYGGVFFVVYEWDGNALREILAKPPFAPFRPRVDFGVYDSQNARAEFTDFDHDGQLELVFISRPRGAPVDFAYPWRKQYDVFEWDGHMYAPYQSEYSPPEYRFQAVQDGDRHTLFGDYAAALASYQEAIFSDRLEWWSPQRLENLREGQYLGWPPLPSPTLPPLDPLEYPTLAAYSRFRIMLLYILQGWATEADLAYRTLIDKYPVGTPGGEFAEMATAFMKEYGSTGSMSIACGAALQASPTQSALALQYLGAQHHGFQPVIYELQYLCPFGYLLPEPTSVRQ